MICECSDLCCPAHKGKCCKALVKTVLWRIDMEDVTGTAFCEACAEDASEHGLFTDHEPLPKQYIGDGIYVEFDGWQLSLSVPAEASRAGVEQRIHLDPNVLQSLVNLAKLWRVI